MAEVTFTISSNNSNGRQANGTLAWSARNLSSAARSGPFGNGFLPLGTYTARRAELLDKADPAYKDPRGLGWMQAMRPNFQTSRTDLGIHPDGNVPGTEGCIGLADADTRSWYNAFRSVSEPIQVEVKNASANLASNSDATELVGAPRRRLNIAVVGSAKPGDSEATAAFELGQWIASRGYTLVAGGGKGVMEAVARGFCSIDARLGVSIGIIPGAYTDEEKARGDYAPKLGYPNRFVEVPIFTHLSQSGSGNFSDKIGPRSRNHLTALSGDLMIVVGGGEGTKSEVAIAAAAAKTVIFFKIECEWHREVQQEQEAAGRPMFRARGLPQLFDLLK